MPNLLNLIGASITLALGLYGLVFPKRGAALVRLSPTNNAKEGQSEFRASFGGLWVGLGAVPLFTMEPLAFAMAGFVWLTAAFGRAISFVLDGTITRMNAINIVFEIGCAGLLLVGTPARAILL